MSSSYSFTASAKHTMGVPVPLSRRLVKNSIRKGLLRTVFYLGGFENISVLKLGAKKDNHRFSVLHGSSDSACPSPSPRHNFSLSSSRTPFSLGLCVRNEKRNRGGLPIIVCNLPLTEFSSFFLACIGFWIRVRVCESTCRGELRSLMNSVTRHWTSSVRARGLRLSSSALR